MLTDSEFNIHAPNSKEQNSMKRHLYINILILFITDVIPLALPVLSTALIKYHSCNNLLSTEYFDSHMSLVMRKPAFCICENKDADQLRGNREADQRLCFRYTDSTIPLLPKSEISSLRSSSVAVQPGL